MLDAFILSFAFVSSDFKSELQLSGRDICGIQIKLLVASKDTGQLI